MTLAKLTSKVRLYFTRTFASEAAITDTLRASLIGHAKAVDLLIDDASEPVDVQASIMSARFMLVALAWIHCRHTSNGRLLLSEVYDWLSPRMAYSDFAKLFDGLVYIVNSETYVDVTSMKLRAARRTALSVGMSARRQGKRIRSMHLELAGMVGCPSETTVQLRPTWPWNMTNMARRMEEDLPKHLIPITGSVAKAVCIYLAWQLHEHPDRAPVIGAPLLHNDERTGETIIAAIPLGSGLMHSLLAKEGYTYYHWCFLNAKSKSASLFNEAVKTLPEREHCQDADAHPAMSLKSRAVYTETKRNRSKKKK